MIKSVWCITLYVSDLKNAIKFYEKTLGLTKKYEYSSYAGFQCGGVEIGLIPKEKMKASKDSPTVEFLVDDVDKFYDELKKKGVNTINPPHDEPWGGRQASFKDPDGNLLEIVQINWKKYFEIAAKGAEKP
jgi:lactoylglutathione lyase